MRVVIDGETVAESTRPTVLFETGLPPRCYLPLSDVRLELLQPSDTTTHCPYKGTAAYWSIRVGGRTHQDLGVDLPQPATRMREDHPDRPS